MAVDEFGAVFAALRQLMLAAAPGQRVASDRDGDLVVHSRHHDASGKPVWFGAVTVKKRYVAYHLFPLYTDPALGEGLSEALAKRRQGKSCFNFTKVDAALFAELAALTGRADAAAAPPR